MKFLRRWKIRILLFFAVVGPGFITANVDNDANGIVTYSQAGAQFGYKLLWTMIPVTVWLIVVKGQYKGVEKIFLVASFLYITYIFSGILAKPEWIKAAIGTFKPPGKELFQHEYLFMTITVIGTTIAPWMQFYLQSSVVEKGVTKRQYKTSQLDVVAGCIFTDIVAWFIIVACAATLFVHGFHNINDAKDAAE